MEQFWSEEMTEEEAKTLIDRLAGEVSKRKMETPAILFAEMHKPLANLGAHAMVAFSPFIAPFLGFQNVNDYSRLLRKPGSLELLIQKMEETRVDRLETER